MKKYIALLLLMFSINQGIAQGTGCWLGDLTHILNNSHTSAFKNFVTGSRGFERFKALREAAESRGLSNTEILDFSQDIARVSNPESFIGSIRANDELIDGWKVLQNSTFRTEIEWLESFNVLKKNNLLGDVSRISEAEAIAIHRYTVNNFELTRGAYTGSLTRRQQEWMNLINSGLDKLRSTKGYQGSVFRGANRPESEIIERYVNVFNEGVSRGITPRVNEPALLSTSKNINVAEDFIRRFNTPENVEVLFEISSKRGVYIDDISDYGRNLCRSNPRCSRTQEEVILSDGQDYEILDIIRTQSNGSTRYLIKLSE